MSPLRTPQSCTSLYTPFGVYAGSSSDAELLSKRERTRNPLSGLRFFSVMYVFVHSRRKIRALRALRAASAQTADNSRMILCRLYARFSRVRPCTLLSAFAQAPRLTRNCFPNGGERAIHCRTCGFSRSCTSLYTPVEKSAPSASCARLRRKRQAIPARYFVAFRRYHVRNGRGRRAMSATGAAGAPCPPRAWSARSILQSKRRVVRYENRRRH